MFQHHISSPYEPTNDTVIKTQHLWEKILATHDHPLHPILDSIRQPAYDLWAKTCQDFQFETYVILGTGGSSLGGQTLNSLHASSKNLIFLENIDPHTMEETLKRLNAETTGFVVISKSGATAETLAQFLVIYSWLKNHRHEKTSTHFLCITTDQDSPLQQLCKSLNLTVCPHPPHVGGRFSVFTAVGMIPLILAGENPQPFFDGAHDLLTSVQTPIMGAAFSFTHLTVRPMHTVMAYGDRLSLFTLWFRQLWAESLGKDGIGSTPIPALGTVDQHSQLQLFAEGPDDKVYSFIMADYKGTGPALTPSFELPESLSYMKEKKLGDLMDAEQNATYQSLLNRTRPIRYFHLPLLNAYHVGALMAHFMIEVTLVAELMGINAFSQPGVEESKVLTRHYLTPLA